MEFNDGIRFIEIAANLTDGMYQGVYHGKTAHPPDIQVRAYALPPLRVARNPPRLPSPPLTFSLLMRVSVRSGAIQRPEVGKATRRLPVHP